MTAIDDAIALARLQRNGKSWVVVAEAVELPEDPTAWFIQEAGRGRILGWMRDGWMVAAGEAFAVEAEGPGRFTALTEAVARLDGRCVVAAPPEAGDLPRLIASAAFADQVDGPAWAGISAARLVLPARCWLRRHDGSGWCVRATTVTANDEPAGVQRRLMADPPIRTTRAPLTWDESTQDYRALVEDAAALIADGALRKVVLARQVDLPCTATPEELIPRLRSAADPEALVYAVDLPDGGCFLGATPELLFSAEDERVHAMALAGSRPRSDHCEQDQALADELFASTKERKEHQLVVEHLSSVLGPRSRSLTVPVSPHVRSLPRLHHLETILDVALQRADHLELLGALHPTPAVCGLPVHMARSWIARREHVFRGLYAGTLGWIDAHRARFWVPLRGGIVRNGKARLFAGAGIVETSDPEREFAETEAKFDIMRGVIG